MIPREPTEAMIDAARRSVSGYPRRETIIAIWRAMFDAASEVGKPEAVATGLQRSKPP